MYAVSDDGQVWSYKSKKFLKPMSDSDGYLQVSLCKEGKVKSRKIHRLVAEAFIPNPLGLPQVNHRNEVKSDNRIENLEWCSAKDNVNYGTRTERTRKPVYCIELDKTFESLSAAAAEVNGSVGHISNCCQGKRNTHCGYHWCYAEQKN